MADRSRPLGLAGAVALPIVVAAALTLLRDVVANTSAALVLVLVVVAVAVRGDRLTGVLAALAAAASFDFFLTPPYLQFVIFERDDIETAVLLTAIGVAVTEVAQWGRREQARAGRREGYLAGVAGAVRMAGEGSSTAELAGTVGRMIGEVLDLDDCRFSPAAPRPDRPRLQLDGSITWNGRAVDVEREGLPTMDTIELPVGPGGRGGVYLLTSTSRVRRPDLEQRLVAVTLAEQLVAGPSAGSSPGSR